MACKCKGKCTCKALKEGTKVEKEHVSGIKKVFPKATKEQVNEMTKEIASQHLLESDSYYKYLKEIEKKFK